MSAGVRVAIAWRFEHDWRARSLLRRAAAAALRAERFSRGELSIAVVADDEMTRLHGERLNIPGPTDVLTFDYGTRVADGLIDGLTNGLTDDLADDLADGLIDGEVIVCADVARRRAAQRSTRLADARAELALYVVHGILHLAGYDDHDPRDARRMHAREDELLAQAGLGAVFKAGANHP